MIARKLTKITHILTINNQYGYEEGIAATTHAIVKVGQYIEQTNCTSKVLLMGISKEFGAVNRTLL